MSRKQLKTQPIPEVQPEESKEYSDDEETAQVPDIAVPKLPRKKRPPPSAASVAAMRAGLEKMRAKGLVVRKQKAEERHVASLASKGYKVEKPPSKEDELVNSYKARIAELEAKLVPVAVAPPVVPVAVAVASVPEPVAVKQKRVYKPRQPKASKEEPPTVNQYVPEPEPEPVHRGRFSH